jgi:hypothetical protein
MEITNLLLLASVLGTAVSWWVIARQLRGRPDSATLPSHFTYLVKTRMPSHPITSCAG